MVFRSLFPSMYYTQDAAPTKARKAATYLLRCVFVMGIRKPPKRFFIIYCLWSFAMNLGTTFYEPIGLIAGIVSNLKDLSPSDFLTSTQVAINVWSCSIKVVIVWYYFSRLEQAMLILDEMDGWLTLPIERIRMHRAVAYSNRVFFFFMSVYLGYAFITFISAVCTGRPPYQNYYPILDWHSSSFQFWVQAWMEYFAMTGACFQDACVDCYPLNFVIPLRAHINIFADRLRRLGTKGGESNEERHRQLVQCIENHKVILRYCDVVQPVISLTIFVQCLAIGVVLGLTLINLVLFADLGSGIAAFTFLVAVMLETTPFSILCNHLADESVELADALFESNWLDAEQSYKKTLLQFMLGLQKPIVFMAIGVFPISVGTNISVIKFAFSVFTFVKQMNIAEKLARPKDWSA